MLKKEEYTISISSTLFNRLFYWPVAFTFLLLLTGIVALFFANFTYRSDVIIFRDKSYNSPPVKVSHTASQSQSSLTAPGVIVKAHGGIGNQLFVYACSYALAREKDWPLYLLVTRFGGRQFQANQRDFALDQFKIPLNRVINSTAGIPPGQSEIVNDESLFLRKFKAESTFIQHKGYCQSELYWVKYKEEISQLFQFKRNPVAGNKQLEAVQESIENTESVAVHIRRGDFVRSSASVHVPLFYQRLAIRRIVKILKNRSSSTKSPTFFVFSDDIGYTLGRLSDFHDIYPFVYVSSMNSTSLQDFYLMTRCKHIIFPDSTFSWWAAYLNENEDKIVIASAFNPKFWTRWGEAEEFDVNLHGAMYHPKSWILIDPFSGEKY